MFYHDPLSDPESSSSSTILASTFDPKSSMDPPTIDQSKQVPIVDPKKYAKNKRTVRRHLLNHMSDPKFDLFVAQKSAKAI